VVVWLDFAGYVQQTPLWSKIPTTMIEKCARVAALRKAYPEAFGGLYIQEEMPATEEPTPSSRKTPKALPLPPEESAAPSEYVEAAAQLRAAHEQVHGHAPVSEEERHVIAGRHKGKALASLDDVSLGQAINDVAEIVNNPENQRKKNYPKAVRSYAALTAEHDLRTAMTRKHLEAKTASTVAAETASLEPDATERAAILAGEMAQAEQ
jgi:hypothetical protein